MAEERQALKHYFGTETAEKLGETILAVYPSFDLPGFVAEVTASVEGLELKARVQKMTIALHKRLPASYSEAVDILLASLGPELTGEEGMFTEGWYLMPVARFVEEYGPDHFEVSMEALQEITRRHTAEYAIRPFLVRYPNRTLEQLHQWTQHESPHVRRLVSEGTRPRLPWASRLKAFIEEPQPVLALLELLKDDPSPFVQKSVANNLNDISKDNPELALEVAEQWAAEEPSENTSWILRHGLRTMVKAGNTRALAVLGFTGAEHIILEELHLSSTTINIGDSLRFSFQLSNSDVQAHKLNVDYLIHLVRSGGRTNQKVFKLKKLTLPPGGRKQFDKKQAFKSTRTRRYYPGTHRLELIVNGRVLGGMDFELR